MMNLLLYFAPSKTTKVHIGDYLPICLYQCSKHTFVSSSNIISGYIEYTCYLDISEIILQCVCMNYTSFCNASFISFQMKLISIPLLQFPAPISILPTASSSVSLFPSSVDANPHCGLRHKRSSGMYFSASWIRSII